MLSGPRNRNRQGINGPECGNFKRMLDQKREAGGLSSRALNQDQARTDESTNRPNTKKQADIHHGDQASAIAKNPRNVGRGLCEGLKVRERQNDFNLQQGQSKKLSAHAKEKMLLGLSRSHQATA